MKYANPIPMPVALCLLFALALQSVPALAQTKMSPEQEAIYRNMMKAAGVDPNAGMDAKKQNDASRQWTEGSGIVDYHVVGVYQGQTDVVGENWIGYADVNDRVVIDFRWKLSESALVGTPTFQNSKSEAKNLRDPEPGCQPPVLKGEYEHYELQKVRQGLSGTLELIVQTSYPPAEVVQFCTGSHKSIPASRKTEPREMVVPSPVSFGMKLPDSDNLRISTDRKSLIHKRAGWTWTFTPSIRKQ